MYTDIDVSRGTPYLEAESNRLKQEIACAIITDCRLEDNPIVFATRQFYTFTGYDPRFVIGKNARFLHGEETDPRVLEKIRHALTKEERIEVELINYTRSGDPFINSFQIKPLFDNDRNISGYASYHKLRDMEKFNDRMIKVFP